MDPQLRKLLEVSYEAWIDSGIDHVALRGSNQVCSIPPAAVVGTVLIHAGAPITPAPVASVPLCHKAFQLWGRSCAQAAPPCYNCTHTLAAGALHDPI